MHAADKSKDIHIAAAQRQNDSNPSNMIDIYSPDGKLLLLNPPA
jgi:hypothetical protein